MDKAVLLLVSANDDGVTTSMLVVSCEGKCIDEPMVLPVSRG